MRRSLHVRFARLGRPAGLAALASVTLLLPASAWGNALLVVTNTHDSGPGSLREAITDSNASSGSAIVFNIPTSDPGFNGGWFTISPLSQLRWLTTNAASISPTAHLYWANSDATTLGSANLDGGGANESFVGGASGPTGVAVWGQYVYWANESGSSIGRANLDGSGVDQNFITGNPVEIPVGIAVDGQHIYWTNAASHTIGRADIDGSNANGNFIGGIGSPIGLAVDMQHLYWTNDLAFGSGGIGRANLDGTGVEPSLVGSLSSPVGVAVDGGDIYWTGGNTIGRSYLDGSSPSPSFVSSGPATDGVAVDGQHLYWTWTNAGIGTIGRANRDGSGVVASLISGASSPYGIAVLDVPGAPNVVSASAGDEQATVGFTTPTADGSPITGYTVTASPGGATATGSASPITIGGLADGTAYTFTVTATNAIGTGDASAPSSPVTPASPTSAVLVTNTNGSGVGSLRAAINFADSNPGPDTIAFAIPTSDPGFNGHWFTIQPSSSLPAVTGDGTTIDGGTQTAFSGDTNPSGPEIFLDGRSQAGGEALSILSSSNVVEGLTIGGFPNRGIGIEGGDGNVVRGNYVGTDPTGTTAIQNPSAFPADGVEVMNEATNTIIGGTIAQARNVISGNLRFGVNLFGSTSAVVEGNYIGTNAAGTATLGNGSEGISVQDGASGITIGGSTAGSGNVISGNGTLYVPGPDSPSGAGVGLNRASSISVEGNLIGTDSGGTYAIPNADNGVALYENVTDAVIGGTTAAARNVISGNGGGVYVSDGCSGDLIVGNYIGTNAAGTAALGNATTGIGIDGTASNTVVGGTAPGAGNVISANRVGIDLLGGRSSMPVGTIIQGNLIGTDATGAYALGNAAAGIGFDRTAPNTVVGGAAPGAGNVISGNGLGIAGAAGTIVQGNDIGTNRAGAAVPNAGDGVSLQGGGNRIEANTIADNAGDGVVIWSPTGDTITGDTITRNSIFSNGGLGIDLGWDGVTPNDPGDADTGPNNLQNFPVLASARGSASHLVVTGTIDTPNPQAITLELFANHVPTPGGDPSGYGQGAIFLGTATPAPNGSFSVTLPSVAPGTVISATATDAAGDTSEFAKDAVTLPASADQCKKGGWQAYGVFKNQGDCVSYVTTEGKNPPAK